MKNAQSKETRSYQDPMASRMEAAQKRKAALEAGSKPNYPKVEKVYDGFYQRLDTLSEEGSRFFLSAGAPIGSKVQLDSKGTTLFTEDGHLLAGITGKTAARLSKHAAQGWQICVLVSAVFYKAESRKASAEFAFLCWAPLDAEQEAALVTFSDNIAHRLASGDRATLDLTQDQFIKILSSKGSWYLTPTSKRDGLPSGTVIYKNRRTGTEHLTAYALKHRRGCTLLASFFWILLLGGLAVLVWMLFFS